MDRVLDRPLDLDSTCVHGAKSEFLVKARLAHWVDARIRFEGPFARQNRQRLDGPGGGGPVRPVEATAAEGSVASVRIFESQYGRLQLRSLALDGGGSSFAAAAGE